MERVFHPYTKWEDWTAGFYDNCSGSVRNDKIKSAVKMFNSEKKTRKYMNKVITEWKYSCEHNLTNEAVNKIAYIGQAACCIYDGIPNTVTMEAWSLLTKEVKDRSNEIANEMLNKWISNIKTNQLCLNLD